MKPKTPYHLRPKLTNRPEADIQNAIHPDIKLSDVAGKTIDLYCGRCDRHSETTATSLMKHAGAAAYLAVVLSKARCTGCGRKGAPEIRLRSGPLASPFDQEDKAE